jgi:single-strand DNA-binding protein
MQKLQIIGNIGKDAEIRKLDNDKNVVSFSVAVTEKYKDKESTVWFNCQKWNAEPLVQYLKQGAKVYVEGKIQEREHEGKKYWSVNVDSLEIVKFAGDGKKQDAIPEQQQEQDDGLPF